MTTDLTAPRLSGLALSAGILLQEGPIWIVERPVVTMHTVTPVEQWGVWDARIILNLEDWAGNYGILPGRESTTTCWSSPGSTT